MWGHVLRLQVVRRIRLRHLPPGRGRLRMHRLGRPLLRAAVRRRLHRLGPRWVRPRRRSLLRLSLLWYLLRLPLWQLHRRWLWVFEAS